jgi:hypothetical protein
MTNQIIVTPRDITVFSDTIKTRIEQGENLSKSAILNEFASLMGAKKDWGFIVNNEENILLSQRARGQKETNKPKTLWNVVTDAEMNAIISQPTPRDISIFCDDIKARAQKGEDLSDSDIINEFSDLMGTTKERTKSEILMDQNVNIVDLPVTWSDDPQDVLGLPRLKSESEEIRKPKSPFIQYVKLDQQLLENLFEAPATLFVLTNTEFHSTDFTLHFVAAVYNSQYGKTPMAYKEVRAGEIPHLTDMSPRLPEKFRPLEEKNSVTVYTVVDTMDEGQFFALFREIACHITNGYKGKIFLTGNVQYDITSRIAKMTHGLINRTVSLLVS